MGAGKWGGLAACLDRGERGLTSAVCEGERRGGICGGCFECGGGEEGERRGGGGGGSRSPNRTPNRTPNRSPGRSPR